MSAFWERETAVWQPTKFAASAIALVILAAGFAWASDRITAQPGAPTPHDSQVATRTAGPIDTLSPGNRLIAEALYTAQQAKSEQSASWWSLDRIAASHNAGQNWGYVFQQMKSDNLLQDETLGQVVIWYQYNYITPQPSPYAGLRSSIATAPAQGRN